MGRQGRVLGGDMGSNMPVGGGCGTCLQHPSAALFARIPPPGSQYTFAASTAWCHDVVLIVACVGPTVPATFAPPTLPPNSTPAYCRRPWPPTPA